MYSKNHNSEGATLKSTWLIKCYVLKSTKLRGSHPSIATADLMTFICKYNREGATLQTTWLI